MRFNNIVITAFAFIAFVIFPVGLSANAQDDLTVVSVNRNLTVRGDVGVYYQIKPGKEFQIKLKGPSNLKVSIRPNSLKEDKNPKALELSISIDARVEKTLTLKRETGKKMKYAETTKYIPSPPVEEFLNIPAGEHSVTFQAIDDYKGGAAIAVVQESTKEDEMPLIPLVPVAEGSEEETPQVEEQKEPEAVAESSGEEAPAWASVETKSGDEETTLSDETKKEGEQTEVTGRPSMGKNLTLWGLISTGVGAAVVIVGGVYGLKAKSKADENNTLVADTKDNLSEMYAEDYEVARKESDTLRDEAQSAAKMSTIMMATGGVLVVTGVVLMVVDGFSLFKSNSSGMIEDASEDEGSGGDLQLFGMKTSLGIAPLQNGGMAGALQIDF